MDRHASAVSICRRSAMIALVSQSGICASTVAEKEPAKDGKSANRILIPAVIPPAISTDLIVTFLSCTSLSASIAIIAIAVVVITSAILGVRNLLYSGKWSKSQLLSNGKLRPHDKTTPMIAAARSHQRSFCGTTIRPNMNRKQMIAPA